MSGILLEVFLCQSIGLDACGCQPSNDCSVCVFCAVLFLVP